MLKFGSPNFIFSSFLLFCLFLYQLLTSVPPLVKFGSPNFTPLLTSSVAPLSLHKHFSGENHFNYLSISSTLPAVQNRCGRTEAGSWHPPESLKSKVDFLRREFVQIEEHQQLCSICKQCWCSSCTSCNWQPQSAGPDPNTSHPLPITPPMGFTSPPAPPQGTPPCPIGKGEGNGDYSDWLVKSGRGNHNNHSGSAHLSWLKSIFSRFCN